MFFCDIHVVLVFSSLAGRFTLLYYCLHSRVSLFVCDLLHGAMRSSMIPAHRPIQRGGVQAGEITSLRNSGTETT